MGTRATLEELKDMIAEVDRSGSNEIDFQEFCLFMVFKVGGAGEGRRLGWVELVARSAVIITTTISSSPGVLQ
jgi:hypothetical protein